MEVSIDTYLFLNFSSSNSAIERPTISGHFTPNKPVDKSKRSTQVEEFNEEERRFYANKLVSDNLENFFDPEFPENLAKTINQRLSDNSFDPPEMAEATATPTMQNILWLVKKGFTSN